MMHLAEKIALKSECKFKVGAVITKGNRVLGFAHNQYKTCPRYGAGSYNFLHAEAAAIKQCLQKRLDIRGSTIWVFRRNHRNSRPCDCCQTLIDAVGIKKVHYSDLDNDNRRTIQSY